MLDSPTSSAALYLGQRGGPGGPPRMAREAPAGFAPVDAAPWRPAVPPLPVLAELVAAFPSAEARLVVVGAGDLGMAAYRDCLHAASTSLDVAALVTTGGAAAAEARATLGRDVTVLVPDRPEDIWRTAGEFAGRLARRTSAPVILQCPDGLVTYAALDLLAEQGVRGVVASAGCSTAGYAARPLRLPVFTTAGSPLSALADGPAGRSIAHSVEAALRRHLARSVVDSRVVVLGYRGRAAAVSAALHGLGARVGVYDPDPIHQCAAVIAGHRALGRREALGAADIVVDLGGLLGGDDGLARLAHEAVLVTDRPDLVASPPGGPPAALEVLARHDELALCRLVDERLYVILAGRSPGHGAPHLVGRLRDLLCGELYLCIRQLAARSCAPGVHRLARSQCADLARRWCRTYQQAH